MPISPPLPRDTRSRLADWIEVECLVAPRGVPASRLRRLWAGLDESGHETESDADGGESLETEILEEEPAAWEVEVAEELEWRNRILGSFYPFQLETSATNWRLARASEHEDQSAQAGRSCYLFCLLISALRDSRIHDDPTQNLTKQAERDFEQVATLAGGGVFGGEALAFGWPRDDGSPFRRALKNVGERLGWELCRGEPLWSTGREKDEGVDVIAWRDFSDRRPGRLLLLGQAATGKGWEKKGDEGSDLFNWFTPVPAMHYLPALFSPFPQHHECTGRKNNSFEAVARAEAWKRERKCGVVVDRLRIVEMVAARLALNGSVGATPTLRRLREWVGRACEIAGG